MLIDINRIRISEEFMKTPPRQDKVENHMNYYIEHGCFKGTIIITERGMLLDGFIDYLIAYNLGMEKVDCNINTDVLSKFNVKYNRTIKRSDRKRNILFEQQSGKCACCGKQLHINPDGDRETYLTLDHIFPASRGGSNNLRNLQGLCQGCNTKKGNRLDNLDLEFIVMPLLA